MALSAPAMRMIMMLKISPSTSSKRKAELRMFNVRLRSIISIEINRRMMLFLLNTNPRNPIRNKMMLKTIWLLGRRSYLYHV